MTSSDEGQDRMTFRVIDAGTITAGDLALVLGLFDATYERANHAYLEKSLTKLRHLAIAMDGGVAAGFALADARVIDLPRLPAQAVNFAGMCCIGPQFRRRGLFPRLERMAAMTADVRPAGRWLSAGRMAHPVSFRVMRQNPSAVPRGGIEPTAWQQEVGAAIADAYGVAAFDPRTFVCGGSGVPIGYPRMEIDVDDEEWIAFRGVNRDRGDSLLGLVWAPDAPEGW